MSRRKTPVRAAAVRSALLQRGLALRTVALYQGELLRAERWCDRHGLSLATISADELSRFVATRPKTWATRHLTHCALAHYWSIVGRRSPPLWAIPVPKKPDMLCRALEPDDAVLLARAARARGDLRGLATLMGLYTALRREEISTLRWDDFGSDGWLRVVGKGSKSARVLVHPVVTKALMVTQRQGPWLFPGRYPGRPVVPATVWMWVRTVADEAGLGLVPTHVLRHTCLATANDNTGDLRATQAFARHARPDTTAGYTRATVVRLRQVVAAIDY